MKATLSDLPYEYDALEPYIDTRTIMNRSGLRL
jgi:superoxide dismutase